MSSRPKERPELSKQQSSKKRNRSKTRPEVSAKEDVAEHKEARASPALLENEAGRTGQYAPFAGLIASNPIQRSHSSRRSSSADSRKKRVKPDLSLESILAKDEDAQEYYDYRRDPPRELSSALEDCRSEKRKANELHIELRTELIRLFKAREAIIKNEEGEGRSRSLLLSNLKEIEESNVKLGACEESLRALEKRSQSIERQLSEIFMIQITLNGFKKHVNNLKVSVITYKDLKKKKAEIERDMIFSQRVGKDSSRPERRADENARKISHAEIDISDNRQKVVWHQQGLDDVDPDQVWEVLQQVPPLLPFEVENRSREASGAVS
jgi:hypothetical protein